MKRFFLGIVVFYLSTTLISAQSKFQFTENVQPQNKELSKKIIDYQIYEFDHAALFQFKQQSESDLTFDLVFGDEIRSFSLDEDDMRSDDYILQVKENGTLKTLGRNSTPTFKGALEGESYGSAHLTIDQNFVMAYWVEDGKEFYLEPLWRLLPEASHNQYIVYEGKSVVIPHGYCGVETPVVAEKSKTTFEGNEKLLGECLDVEIALAADFEMFQAFGSVASVESFILGVLANVQTNYDDEFDDELNFVVTTSVLASSNATDPWTNDNNAGTLLDDFVDWGNDGGFGGASYDVASIWTDRNFTGSTIGVAYLNGICTFLRYGAIENFSNSAALLRVVWAHELGHNFNSGHDGTTGFIMSPSVNNTNTWSTASQNSINNYVASRNCLSTCAATGAAPEADFSFSTEIGCAPLVVDFFDESTGDPDFWEWDFAGGDPSFSNDPNPVVTYFDEGTYDVSLYVENATGDDTETISGAIVVLGLPTPDFDFFIDGFNVDMINNSVDAEDYEWDFDDGNFSFSADPLHTYEAPGEYDVTLTAFNECGSESFTVTIVIESTLEAAFTNTAVEGCEPLEVSFFDNSEGNPTSWQWEFPGGTPETSELQNPVILYSTSGTYDVSLTVSSDSETDMISFSGFVIVDPDPVADFTVNVTEGEQTPDFNNNSSNADTYFWDFGDDESSDQENPSHTYTEEGTYTVTLTATNECGEDIHTQEVTIVFLPEPSIGVSTTTACVPATVMYTASPTGDGLTYEWTFEGGDPSTSDSANPSVVYGATGSYSATLVVTNAAGSTTVTEEDIVVVNTIPNAGFTVDNIAANGTVTLTNESSNADSWHWNFGDDESSDEENPSHTYTEEGTYTVTLTATNECGDDTHTQEVTIVFLPEPSIGVSTTTACAPATVMYTASPVGEGLTYEWTFEGGDPSTSDSANPSVVYGATGSYSATLVVTNAAGSTTVTEENVVVVNTIPNAEFTVDNIAANGTVTFSNQSTNNDSWHWNFGDDESSDEENPSHTYTEEGTYTVILTASNECGDDTHTQEVTIVFLPEPSIGVSTTTACAPATVMYTASPVGDGLTYEWTFEGGDPSTSTDANPSVVYNAVGSYGATLVVTNAAGSTTVTEENVVVVNTIPNAEFTVDNIAANGTVTFGNQSTNNDNWQWNFGDDESSDEENPSHTYTEEGTYTVTLTATNECGDDTHTQEVTIVFLPEPSISVSTTTACAPATVMYTASPTGDGLTYEWTFEGGDPSTSTDANPSVVYNAAGSYGATLVVTNAAGSTTVTEENIVVVNTIPNAAFTVEMIGLDGTVTFNNESGNADSWHWDFGDDESSDQENPSHTYTEEGTYTVALTATNECGDDTHTQEVTIVFPPNPSIQASVTEGCEGMVVNFEAMPAGEGYSYAWVFPGGEPGISTMANPEVTYNTVGNFNASLTVTNAAGVNTATEMITVLGMPEASFDFTVNGLTVVFENNSVNATSYSWDIDGTTVETSDPMYTFPSTGEYDVVLTAINTCGMHTFTSTIVIEGEIPSINFTAQNNEGCADLMVNFESEVGGADELMWVFEGGEPASSTLANPVVTYQEPGVYNVTLTASNVFGSNALTQTEIVVVHDLTVAGFEFVYDGATVNFENTSLAANTIEWQFPDASTSNVDHPSFDFPGNGTYEVTLVANGNCNTDMITQTITIDGTISNSSFTTDITTGCAPLTVMFTDESTESPTAWNWTFPGGTPGTSQEQHVEVVYETPGVYDVFLETSNEFGGNQIALIESITVALEPTEPMFSMGSFDGFTWGFTVSDPNADYVYTWEFGNGETATGIETEHTYTEEGNYIVTLTASNACGEATSTEEVSIFIESTNTPDWASKLSLFPNPTNGIISIDAQGWPGSGKMNMNVVNVLGQQVEYLEMDVNAGQWSYQLDWQHLPAGTYMIQLNWGDEAWTEKLIVL